MQLRARPHAPAAVKPYLNTSCSMRKPTMPSAISSTCDQFVVNLTSEHLMSHADVHTLVTSLASAIPLVGKTPGCMNSISVSPHVWIAFTDEDAASRLDSFYGKVCHSCCMIRLGTAQVPHHHVTVPNGLYLEQVVTAGQGIKCSVQPVKHGQHLQQLLQLVPARRVLRLAKPALCYTSYRLYTKHDVAGLASILSEFDRFRQPHFVVTPLLLF